MVSKWGGVGGEEEEEGMAGSYQMPQLYFWEGLCNPRWPQAPNPPIHLNPQRAGITGMCQHTPVISDNSPLETRQSQAALILSYFFFSLF